MAAAILIGMLIDTYPEVVWNVVEELGKSSDPLIRMIVATTLLEHLIEHDSATYDGRAEDLAKTSGHFRDTLGMCWFRDATQS